jgi:hypothetical protein
LLCLLGAAACATAPRTPNAAMLKLITNVPEATLWIDDRLAGRAAEWAAGRVLVAGFRRIEVRQPGFFTFYQEINPRPGDTITVHAELRPELD